MALSPAMYGILGLTSAVAYLAYRAFISSKIHYPPGPRPYPIIGNLFDIPPGFQEVAFAKLAEKYGDVMHLSIFGRDFIILSNFEAARDLMDKRSAIYSDRPHFVLLIEMIGADRSLGLLPYGDQQRKHTRLVREGLSPNALLSYRRLQEYEVTVLLQEIMTTPDEFRTQVRRFTASILLQLTYGHRVISMADDKYVQLSETALKGIIDSGTPGLMPVDLFPVLKYLPAWFPGMGFKRHANLVREDLEAMRSTLFEMAKENMKPGSTFLVSSLMESYSRDGKMSEEDELDIRGAVATLYGACVDTSTSVIETFILAMLHYPDVYRKAQEEIDHVIGTKRLPELADRDSLPYFEAIMKELYRWHPPLPLGIPHRLMKNDHYQSYHIPKGALVMANIWAITQNPDVYDEPQSFRPERYIYGQPLDAREMVFGFGRRICPGKAFGDTNAWLATVSIAAAFQISGQLSEKDRNLDYTAFTTGFVSHPAHFECRITPRSGKIHDLILQTATAREA